MKKIILPLSILLLSIFPLYQLFALNNLEVQNVNIQNLGINNQLLLTVEGTGVLYNPSMIPVTVKKIDYIGTIKNETVFQGTIAGMTIPAGEAVEFPFSEEIDWVPDAATVKEILAGQNVTLVLRTETSASYLFFFTFTGEKEVEISLTTLVKPYVEEQIAALSERLFSLK